MRSRPWFTACSSRLGFQDFKGPVAVYPEMLWWFTNMLISCCACSTTFGISFQLVFLGYLEIFCTNQCPPIVQKLFEANNYGLCIHLEWEK